MKAKKKEDVVYWQEKFLKLKVTDENFHKTNLALTECKKYILKEEGFSNTDKLDYLNKTLDYFRKEEQFQVGDYIETEKYGYYHATNEGGFISWFDFTKEIYRQAGLRTNVLPVTTAEYGLSKAARPFNSRLDKSKLVEAGFKPLPTWQDALSRYLKEIGEVS